MEKVFGPIGINMTSGMREPGISCSHDGGLNRDLPVHELALGRLNFKRELLEGRGILHLIAPEGLKLRALES